MDEEILIEKVSKIIGKTENDVKQNLTFMEIIELMVQAHEDVVHYDVMSLYPVVMESQNEK